MDVEVIEAGSLVVPGRYFTEMVKRLPSGEINLKSEDNLGLTITYDQSEFFINGFSADEFPSLPEIDENVQGRISQGLLKKIIRQTSIAASNDESRPIFTGTLMEIIDDRITLVTTDTHRLSVRKAFWQGNTDEEKISVIIPTKTMVEISRIISDEEEPITVIVGNNQVCFNIGTITFL